MPQINIGLDMMGGDFAPEQAVKGLRLYLQANNDPATIYCIGKKAIVEDLLQTEGVNAPSVVVIDASEIIGYHEHPTKALKEKQQSSIAVGFSLLSAGKIHAFISAGNTGAMLVGAMHTLKPIEGVQRPTIATLVPKLNGNTGLLLDVGLNVDCKPEQLNQFALLGTLYAKHILNIPNPRVALLNVGEEEGKGNVLVQATYPLLKANKHVNFKGNIEGRDIVCDKADIVVCDGFTGNIVLKMAESIYDISEARGFENDNYFHRFHYENYGGTPVLGVAKPVIIGHGISNAIAFKNMMALAEKMVISDFCGKIQSAFRLDTSL